MNILLLSEQSPFLVGGTVTYMKKIVEYLSVNNNVFFVYPSSLTVDKSEGRVRYIGISIGCVWNDSLGWKYRYAYVKEVNKYIRQLNDINIVHILHGFFLLEKLDYAVLRHREVKVLITIHNIPPKEGGDSWKSDNFFPYYRNLFFQELRKILFLYRLNKSHIDCFVVPSYPVFCDLKKIISRKKCEIIPHGLSRSNISMTDECGKNKLFTILTVGGIAPHKNQLLIPEIAKLLLENGIQFQWIIVGPVRNVRYEEALIDGINSLQSRDCIKFLGKVGDDELSMLYQTSDLYVHLSYEEGFCLTALDAAGYHLPIVGLSGVGEISEIIKRSCGVCVEKNNALAFSKGIIKAFNTQFKIDYTSFQKYYSWKRVVQVLESVYSNLINL